MVDYLGIGGPGQIGNIRPTQTNKANEVGSKDGAQFASALESAKEASASTDVDSARATKIAELKAQVADGSYQPDMKQVSSSLLSFIVES